MLSSIYAPAKTQTNATATKQGGLIIGNQNTKSYYKVLLKMVPKNSQESGLEIVEGLTSTESAL